MPELVVNGLAWFIAWLFAVAALHKFRAPAYYQGLLNGWFPGVAVGSWVPYIVAASELGIAIAVLLPSTRGAGLLAAAMVLLLYAVVMGLQLAGGRGTASCGCAGPASSLVISAPVVLRNLLCAALALLALLPLQAGDHGLAGAALSASVAAFLIAGYLTSEQLIVNAQHLARNA